MPSDINFMCKSHASGNKLQGNTLYIISRMLIEEAYQTLHMCPRALLLDGSIEFNLSNVQKLHSHIAELQLSDRNVKKL